jgi:hypothetical protein
VSFLDEIGSAERSERSRVGDERRRSRRTWLVLLMLALLLAAGYVGLHRFAEGRAPFGTSIEGVGVGGLTAAEAGDRLSAELGPRLAKPVVFTHGDRSYPFDAVAAGMRLDVPGTLRAAGVGEPRWTPAALWTFLTSGRDLHATVAVDQQRFTDALDALTARIGQPLVEGDVRFVDGRPRTVIGQAGLTVDHARTQTLVERLAFAGHPGELPLTTRRPYVAPDAVRAALRDIARPAMSGPVVLDLDGHRVSVPPAVLGQALDMVPSQGRLVLLVDADHLADLVIARARTLGPKPVDATVRLHDGRPVVVPAVDGITFDHQQLAQGLPAVLRRPAGRRVLTVHAVLQRPDRTTADVRGWQIRSVLASAPVTDPGVAAGALDGALVVPGGSLHLAKTLGRHDAPLATALFTAALRAGLAITSSTVPTSYDDSLPVGLQRTDVTLRAPADTGVLVALRTEGSRVTLVLWGASGPRVRVTVGPRQHVVPAPVGRSDAADCTGRPGTPGFVVVVHRHIRGQSPEEFVSRYAPVAAVECVPASPTASPSASPSSSPSGAAR